MTQFRLCGFSRVVGSGSELVKSVGSGNRLVTSWSIVRQMVICAWGSHKAVSTRAPDVLHLLRTISMDWKLFHPGMNLDASPKHPLYIAASARPNSF
ncbi:DUF1643 domain-containing protein [Paraburkholderia sp. UYCP14C]|uniref:DUF1643 domain-containing protein n=1 Tax=Paraburkholderia sp. UYCP14C TaxID=2511130 RepID=UPI00145A02D8|nr:DUF1643 domain-containing protein [Paraburkholderia sp. UYCP14C]